MQDHPKRLRREDFEFRWERRLVWPLGVAIGLLSGWCTARADTVGAHLYSPHFDVDRDAPEHLQPRDFTPGVYWRSGSGWTAGVVRNSYSRWSVYGGKTFETADGRFALTVGAVTGYRYETQTGPSACGRKQKHDKHVDPNTCWWTVGSTNAVLRVLVAPSVAFPEAKPYIGAVPRVALLGKAVAITLEWQVR